MLTERAMSETFDLVHYGELMGAKMHDDAIAYVDRFRAEDPNDPDLRRYAALARGAKGEHAMESFDRMEIRPSPQRIEDTVRLFQEAIDVDPGLADPYWDLAVIHGRFKQDPISAGRYLATARKLGYQHPMMPELERMIVGMVRR